MILVAGDEFPQLLRALHPSLLDEIVGVREVQAHGRDLVDDQHPELVRERHGLFRIRIVRGAVGVGPNPPQQFVVTDEQGHVEAAPVDREIFVPAETCELHGLAVEQQAIARNLYRADADFEPIGIGRALAFMSITSSE